MVGKKFRKFPTVRLFFCHPRIVIVDFLVSIQSTVTPELFIPPVGVLYASPSILSMAAKVRQWTAFVVHFPERLVSAEVRVVGIAASKRWAQLGIVSLAPIRYFDAEIFRFIAHEAIFTTTSSAAFHQGEIQGGQREGEWVFV